MAKLDPSKRKLFAQVVKKFISDEIGVADLLGLSRMKIRQLAEIGYIKYKHGRLDEAEQIFDCLTGLDHLNYYYHSLLGGIYQKKKRFVDAIVEYSRALRLNSKDAASMVNRGEVFLRNKKYRQAADDFRGAILLDPDGRNLWANRARSLVIALKRNMEAARRPVRSPRQPAARPLPRRR